MTTTAKIKINASESFRQELAEKMIEQSDPAYHDQGSYYADPVEGRVYFDQTNSAWRPWAASATIVAIDECFDTSNDFDPSIDWDLAEIPYRNMVASYLESEKQEFEDDGDIPEWVSRFDVIEFCRDSEAFGKTITECEKTNYEEAVSFAKSQILEEVKIESNENY